MTFFKKKFNSKQRTKLKTATASIFALDFRGPPLSVLKYSLYCIQL